MGITSVSSRTVCSSSRGCKWGHLFFDIETRTERVAVAATLRVHCGQMSEHAREIARRSHRLIRKTLHVAVTTAASSCEFEAKFSFYFNEVHRR